MLLKLKNQIKSFQYNCQSSAFLWSIWFCVIAYWFWAAPFKWFYQDSAYLFFRILNHEALFYDRFINAIPLIPAIIASHFSLPINVVLQLLNLGFICFCTIFLAFKVEKKINVFLFIFTFLLLSSDHYFIGFSEVLMSSFGFICLLIQLKQKHNWPIVIYGFICLNAHPVGIVFIAVYFYICILDFNKHALLWVFIPIAFWLATRIWLPINNYDKGLMQEVLNFQNWKNISNNYAWQFYTTNFLKLFWGLLVMLIISLHWVFKHKLWLKFVLDIVVLLSLFLVFIVVYHNGDGNAMMEKFIFPFTLIACSILYIHFANTWVCNNHWILIPILICSLWITNQSSKFFINRNIALNKVVEISLKANLNKAIVSDSLVNGYQFGNTWALPYESLLWSNYVNLNAVSLTLDTNKLKQNEYAQAVFNLPGKISKLNTKYFKMDSMYTYKRLVTPNN